MDRNIHLSCGGNVALSGERDSSVRCDRGFERLILFRSGEDIAAALRAGERCPLPPKDICAAALIKNGEIVSFGQVCPFNWSRAKAAVAKLALPRARGGNVMETRPAAPSEKPAAPAAEAKPSPPPPASGEKCPLKAETAVSEDMFSHVFPKSEWRLITYPHTSVEYITGRVYSGDTLAATALGLPGRYAPAPPRSMAEFDIYLSAKNGRGYWLMFRDTEGVRLSREHVRRFMF